MTIKAGGRSALLLAAALLASFAGPSQAAVTADTAASVKSATVKHVWRNGKTYAHHRYARPAVKTTAKTDDIADADPNSMTLPPSVANANAELAPADVPGGNAKAMTARANDLVQRAPDNATTTEVAEVTADQLNEVDRALQNSQQAAAPVATASADVPAVPVAPAMTASRDSSTWDETSLIGKIFIAFGGLLTLASAARMFMA